MGKILIVFISFFLYSIAAQAQLWIEAESFTHRGGWKLDHQAFPQIGSAYLNAHGMGNPVEDAYTDVETSEPGTYHAH